MSCAVFVCNFSKLSTNKSEINKTKKTNEIMKEKRYYVSQRCTRCANIVATDN